MKVTPKESKAVQEIAFKNGYHWGSRQNTTIDYTNKSYLFILAKRFTHSNTMDIFIDDNRTEITPEAFIALFKLNNIENTSYMLVNSALKETK